MKKIFILTALLIIASGAIAATTVCVYESDMLTPFNGRNIMVGTELKLVVASDANDCWSGGLFLRGADRNLARLFGHGKDPNARDYADSHWLDAGPAAMVMRWEDSIIEGFDLFSDVNCVPGDWFVIDYVATAPGDPNIGFYDYNTSWVEPNEFVLFHQVPAADFNTDGIVSLADYGLLASCWLEEDCTDPNGCGKADLDKDGAVDVNDLFLFMGSWLWGVSELNEPNVIVPVDPESDPNLIFRIVDAYGNNEISLNVGQTVTLYVDMVTLDVNEVWAFDVEVLMSDPALAVINNTAYDTSNPPGEGTARILASPNRWTAFDRWGPGYQQQEGIVLQGLSTGDAFGDGYLASFELTAKEAGDVTLSLYNWDTTSTSGERLFPTMKELLIHQSDTVSQMMAGAEMMSMSLATETSLDTVPRLTTDEMVLLLDEIWLSDDGIQDMIAEDIWINFIEQVKQADEQTSISDGVVLDRKDTSDE